MDFWRQLAVKRHFMLKPVTSVRAYAVILKNYIYIYIYIYTRLSHYLRGGTVASWLVRSSPDRAVRVRALAGDIALCPWTKHLTLTVPLSTQVYKWEPANLMLGVTLRWTSIPSRGE